MKTIKEQLLSNSYEYLRTLPNFDKIREELDELEKFMFKCADEGMFSVFVNISPYPYEKNPYSDIKTGNYNTDYVTDDILKLYCEMNHLYLEEYDTNNFGIKWVK